MSKNLVSRSPRFKRQRRLGVELPGLGKPGALDRKPYPPGQHGNQKRKLSEYALRLEEKQKLIFHYGLREEQLRRFVRDSKRGKATDWVDTLVGRLERRLDNLVFRMGLAPSIKAAKQMICHGHVLVNNKKVTVGSAVLKAGDKVKLIPAAYKSVNFMQAQKAQRLSLADYLGTETSGEEVIGTVKEIPNVSHIPFPFEPGLVAEHYAARKA
jgi:small subunit ribosomal protein S4